MRQRKVHYISRFQDKRSACGRVWIEPTSEPLVSITRLHIARGWSDVTCKDCIKRLIGKVHFAMLANGYRTACNISIPAEHRKDERTYYQHYSPDWNEVGCKNCQNSR